jgi:hypothetical protein
MACEDHMTTDKTAKRAGRWYNKTFVRSTKEYVKTMFKNKTQSVM